MSIAANNEVIVQRFYDAICSQNFDKLVSEIYAPNAEIWHNTDRLTITPEQNLLALHQLAESTIKYTYEIHRRIDFESGFVLKFTMHVELKNGREISIPVCAIFDVKGERITRLEEYYDPAAVQPIFAA